MLPRSDIDPATLPPFKIAIFASGNGSNAEAILNHTFSRDIIVTALLCNNRNANVVNRFQNNSNFRGNTHIVEWNKIAETREMYDARLTAILKSLYQDLDLIVLAGWMHIMSEQFIREVPCPVINLHPALPGEFPGAHAMQDAWKAYSEGRITRSGIMAHHVDTGIDTGNVICKKTIPIHDTDSFEDFENRMKTEEKDVIIGAIQEVMDNVRKIYIGKVRDLYCIDKKDEMLLLRHSDRLSALNTHACCIRGKGEILCALSEFWFNATRDIVPNHMLHTEKNVMIAKRTNAIPLEIIVRGYLAGNSPTSIWTMYDRGDRVMYGHTFPDGMKKNQRLEKPIITPTTKGATDHPITGHEIVKHNILTTKQWDRICDISMKLFERGSHIAAQHGLILADTKYEFGFLNGNIVLIDEIHTPDSSRFWYRQDYEANMLAGLEPRKLDKDQVRDFVKSNPGKPIPSTLKQSTYDAYAECLERLAGKQLANTGGELAITNSSYYSVFNNYLENKAENIVVILSGSQSDAPFVATIQDELKLQKKTYLTYYASAHKQARYLLKILDTFRNRHVVYITVAGMSNALSGFVAGNQPGAIVIACPPFKNRSDLLRTDINSSLAMPSNVPVMTVVGARNAAQAAARILKN